MIDNVTTTGAAAAVVSPWWLPLVHGVSDTCALLLPVLGVVWLVIQLIDWFARSYTHEARKD